MIYEKTLAVPLSRRNFKEHHLFMTLFTEKRGLVHAIGYGMGHFGSKRAGNLDMMNLCEIELTQKRHIWTIHSCRGIHPYYSVKQQLEKSLAALASAPFLIRHLPQDVPNGKTFLLLVEFLNILESREEWGKEALNMLFMAFQIKTLGLLGHFPHIKSSICHAPNGRKSSYAVFYDPFSVRCDSCLKKSPLPLSAETLNRLLEIEKRPLSEISFAKSNLLANLLSFLVSHFSETKTEQRSKI